jgi:GABA permease
MPTILVVANQTLGGAALTARLEERNRQEPCDFYVVVPATPPKEHLVWTEGEARAIASERLERCLGQLRDAGLSADGQVGDANPMLAIGDALRGRDVSGVIIATLPAGVSRWLKRSLPERVARRVDVPVDHVVIDPADA